jgi:hypothetical protein
MNSTGPNLKFMTINSNHQNSKHDDVPNIMWTCQLCIREDQNASKKDKKDTLFWMHVYINLTNVQEIVFYYSMTTTSSVNRF